MEVHWIGGYLIRLRKHLRKCILARCLRFARIINLQKYYTTIRDGYGLYSKVKERKVNNLYVY